jgi:mono/diheme cytochrome c family protein
VAAAIVLAWHPAIDRITPPAPGSFDRYLVAEGEDLAKLGNCAGCHTNAPSRPLAGGRALDTPFGKVFASNITPHADDGIGTWSDQAFERAMRRGISRGGAQLYPAFPYDHFTHASDHQIEALYAWLMTRKPIAGRAPEPQLAGLYGFRPLVAVWNLLYLNEGPLQTDSSRPGQWDRGRLLAEGLGHCGSCHTPRTRFGAEDVARAYDGAWAEGWYAPPLNAHSPAVRPWTPDELYAYLRTGLGPNHAAAAGPMGDVTRALAQATDEDLHAIAIYISSLMADAPASRQDQSQPIDRLSVAQQQHPGAAILFAGTCAACHEPGAPMMQLGRPALSWGTPLHEDNPHDTVRIIMQGLTPPAGASGPTMPAYADMLSDWQIQDLAGYLRARFTDKPAWSRVSAAVAEARK